MKKFHLILSYFFFLALFSTPPTSSGASNSGGTPSSPSVISLQSQNVININSFHNYFTYYGRHGDTIYIHATLKEPLDWTSYARCSNNPSYPVGISVNGRKESCNENLTYVFEEDGNYTFHIEYQQGNSGFFEAAVKVATEDSEALPGAGNNTNCYTKEQLEMEYEKGLADGCNMCSNPSSLEDIKAFVSRFYQQCLNREPDSDGLNYWANNLSNGNLTGTDLAKSFVFSEEFQDRKLSNSEFLTVLYKSFFDREADVNGYNHWSNLIANGATRSSVLEGFLSAQEFRNLCDEYNIPVN